MVGKKDKITKAVIAAAGYGTRFLPATKNQPKEMLPVVDKPIIQYVVEEAVEAGVTEIIIVTRAGRTVLEDHFDSNLELEQSLEKSGKVDFLKKIREIPLMANFVYVRQKEDLPYGNASPLLAAKHLIDDDESFIFMFGDDLVLSEEAACAQLVSLWEKDREASFVAAQVVPWEEINRYDSIVIKEGTEDEIWDMIEKPELDEAPSNLTAYGRAIFNNTIFDFLDPEKTGKDGELWLWEAVSEMAKKHRVRAASLKGEWMTTGDPIRYLKTVVRFALEREDLGEEFRDYLKSLDI